MPPELIGEYEPLALLKEGGHRQTLLLQDAAGGLAVLKRSSNDLEDPEKEYRLLTALAGEGLPAGFRYIRGDGAAYLLREYVPGETLLDYMQKRGVLPVEEAAEIGIALCRTLERLHRQVPPVIHRDIKAENIIRTPDGRIVLIDLGIARRYDSGASQDTQVLGTAHSAAPEQFGFRQTDPRTDIYAIGVLLHELVSGEQRPDKGDTPAALLPVIRRCTRFAPEDRYQSVTALRRDLEPVHSGRGPRRGPRPAALILAAAFVLTAGLLFALSGRGGQTGAAYVFASPEIEAEVCRQLGKPPGTVTRSDLEQISSILLCGNRFFEDWEQMRITGESVSIEGRDDFAPGGVDTLEDIPNLPNLEELALCKQDLTDLTPLAGCGIRRLALHGNAIGDVSPLAACGKLQILYISDNPVYDLSPLVGCLSLWWLNAGATGLVSLDSLANLPRLTYLELHDCIFLEDISALERMDHVRYLFLRPTDAEKLVIIGGLTQLTDLYLWGDMGLTDLTPLSRLTNLHRLFLDIPGLNSLKGIEPLTQLEFLDLRTNEMVDVAPLAGLPALTEIYAVSLLSTDWFPLRELPALTKITCSVWQEEVILEVLEGTAVEIVAQQVPA